MAFFNLNEIIASPWLLTVAVLLCVAFFIQLYYYLRYYLAVWRSNRAEKRDGSSAEKATEPVSVIICARNEGDNLVRFLPLILDQNYPDFEVIVVNDGSTDDTEDVLNILKQKYANLYITSLSNQVRVLSPKKLAMTIGIKAAKNELLLFTDADCRPQSPDWITTMVRHFSPTTEFVLGYGGYFKEKSLLNRMICFDTLFIAMQYFGFARAGHPYMGIGRNMAYRKSMFFRNRGFEGHLHVASGDDDLLVNSVANRNNTRIESSAEGKTLSLPKESLADWLTQKRRHLTTAPLYTVDSRRRLAIEPLSRGLFYLCLILAALSQNWLLMLIAAKLFLVRYIIQLSVVNTTARLLDERRFYLSLPLWDIVLPLLTLYAKITQSLFGRRFKSDWKKN